MNKNVSKTVKIIVWSLVIGILFSTSVSAEKGKSSKKSEKDTFGAQPDALGPVGGGEGYANIVTKGDFNVETIDELIEALKKAKPGQVVYVDDKAELDVSIRVRLDGFCFEVPAGVTLASGRGHKGSKGALLCSREFKTSPLIKVLGNGVRITGLRIQGPDPEMWWTETGWLTKQDRYYEFPVSRGIYTDFPKIEVDNCEIWAFSHAGICVYTPNKEAKALVHHNHIHHCQRRGLGYGVSLDKSEALIESNLFNDLRHAIAATGAPGTSYEACNNTVEGGANGHSFDMHGGSDRKDGTSIAGEWIKIHHNTFRAKWKSGYMLPICIRGEPTKGGEVYNNWFLQQQHDRYHTCRTLKGENVKIYHNAFGEKKVVRDTKE